MAKEISKFRRKVEKAAKKVNKFTGATNLAKYAGETLARRKNKNVKRTVTGKQALKSGASVALTVGTGGAGLGRKAIAKGATKAIAKRKAVKLKAKRRQRGLTEPIAKQRLRKYENEARGAAKKRAAAKRKKK